MAVINDTFGSGVRKSGIAFIVILSNSKGKDELFLSFFIAPTLVPTVIENRSSELLKVVRERLMQGYG